MKELLKLSFSWKGRLFAGILGPPLLGGLAVGVISAFWIFTEAGPVLEGLAAIVVITVFSVIFAYMFVGMQSLVFGLLMECVVRRLATRKFHIVASAVVMGLVAAATYRMDSPFFMLLGLLIGFCLGLFLSHSFEEEQSGKDPEQ